MSFIPHSLSTKQITRGQDRHDTQQWFNNKLNKCDWIIPLFVGTPMPLEVIYSILVAPMLCEMGLFLKRIF